MEWQHCLALNHLRAFLTRRLNVAKRRSVLKVRFCSSFTSLLAFSQVNMNKKLIFDYCHIICICMAPLRILYTLYICIINEFHDSTILWVVWGLIPQRPYSASAFILSNYAAGFYLAGLSFNFKCANLTQYIP